MQYKLFLLARNKVIQILLSNPTPHQTFKSNSELHTKYNKNVICIFYTIVN